jgi:hypothetical protein
MARTTNGIPVRVVWSLGVGMAAVGLSLARAQAPAGGQEARSFEIQDFGVVPRPAVQMALLGMESVQAELKLTDAQTKELEAIQERHFQKMQQARRQAAASERVEKARRDAAALEKFQAVLREQLKGSEASKKGEGAARKRLVESSPKARGAAPAPPPQDFQAVRDAIFQQTRAAIQATLKPGQRERLDQIQLRAQGPIAFDRPEMMGPMATMAYAGPPLAERLKLSGDQVRRIRALIQEGEPEIARAASFPIPLDSKGSPPTAEAIHKLVESPEFQAAKQKARQAGRDAVAAVIRRIEGVLTDAQRQEYHKLLGEPFDLSRLGWGGQDDRRFDIQVVSAAFGVGGGGQGGGGQRADPDFNTKVARPAYAGAARRPRVLFDEAHHNFHTATGRYKPFAELITNDGYQVIPNREKFTREVLRKGDILVIANALGAEGMGQPGASNPAFTDAECDAVRDWIRSGGALLFITDHAPMGSAAECLAKRFGVDMSKGATSDPVNSEGGATFLVFSRQNHLLGDHPITRGRDDSEQVKRIQTFTGTSLKGPAGSVPILKLADTAVDHSFDDGNPASAAGRSQGLALTLGQGRVVVMGEAAELSAQVIGAGEKFGMNVPGIDNRQMALNILHWLSGLLDPPAGALKKAG